MTVGDGQFLLYMAASKPCDGSKQVKITKWVRVCHDSLVRDGNSDFAFCQPLDRLLKGPSEDSGLGLLMRTPKDAVDGPVFHQRNVGCNLNGTA